MTNHTIFFSTLLLLADLVVAQEPQEFSSPNEKEDSLSSLSVIPLKSAQASKVLRLVIKQYDKDMNKINEKYKYHVSATFRHDSLAPFTARCVVSPYAGMDFFDNISVFTEKFVYDGQYDLTEVDSILIQRYLKHFARMSPTYVPMIYSLHLHSGDDWSLGLNMKNLLYPLVDYGMTQQYYNYSVSRIEDSAGRRVYRIVFSRNKKKKQYMYAGNVYNVGEVTGTAYFDGKTMRLTQFKGRARRPTDRYDINIRYRNDYEEKNDTLVLKQTIIVWEAGHTEIQARVTRLE